MLILDGRAVQLNKYPDGTLLLKQGIPTFSRNVTISWKYENDGELFALLCLVRQLQGFNCKVSLYMPYIPNARMDRVKNVDDVYTLKYFAEAINSMGFDSVTVLDPHSHVSEALIERIRIIHPDQYVCKIIEQIKFREGGLLMFYPDEGAMKRYSDMFKMPYAFGVKTRDWSSGKILGLEIMGDKERINGSNILIVDDICSKGGTFYHAAKALKDCGAKDIYLFVTHCENTILEGEVLTSGLIERVYTTDSICTVMHDKLEVMKF